MSKVEKLVEISTTKLFKTTTQEIENPIEKPTTEDLVKQTTEVPSIVDKDENKNMGEPESFITKIKKFVEKILMKIHDLG